MKIGCEIIDILLSNAEGVRFLIEAKVLQDIAECLAQLDPVCQPCDILFPSLLISLKLYFLRIN